MDEKLVLVVEEEEEVMGVEAGGRQGVEDVLEGQQEEGVKPPQIHNLQDPSSNQPNSSSDLPKINKFFEKDLKDDVIGEYWERKRGEEVIEGGTGVDDLEKQQDPPFFIVNYDKNYRQSTVLVDKKT